MKRLVRLLGSHWTFVAIVVVFASQAIWLALTSRFPMAFDEAYHFGLIRFFGHHLNPLILSQPPHTNQFGNLAHNTSLLYHYLLSFPYRLISFFTANLEVQVIVLRGLNIVLAVANLLVARKLLRLLRLSPALSNLVLLAFTFTPITVVLAAQINYDNLLLLLITSAAYELIWFLQTLRQDRFDAPMFVALVATCLFASLVQYSFLPIFLAVCLVLLWTGLRQRHRWSRLWTSAKASFAALRRPTKVGLAAMAALAIFGFTWIYGVNVVRYHNPVPQCSRVLKADACRQYYSWAYINDLHRSRSARPAVTMNSATHYAARAYFMGLFGEILPLQGADYLSGGFAAVVIMLISLAVVCLILGLGQLTKEYRGVLLLSFISLSYLLFLLAKDYDVYRYTGLPAVINGRYLALILLWLYALAGVSVQVAVSKGRHRFIRTLVAPSLAAVVIVAFISYGGALPYVRHIDPQYGHLGPSNNFYLNYSD